ncbi:hypothetical protein TREMEDRAFT_25849 [Tremella mesenterica DSM 1558]|uniref:uncharacterized protein n=1 Tax=Tremella mesenterica (strain ATCC 24925 / CBS 8224 / DSM 1558 / NBRC 9311 / NRRL Y-6157 / RJB 2259-6 / UBC 559-6) TaxID=578456 RepID=UPI0003F49828|nr:uncharacterized protein TREMEDRAFT_25849 [Tremella mesenterica DSM 1558]EIW72380.1 hypothetical protein TREMEDRAFT_25849 [Tremella mesenterica DSM 1558]
MTSQDDGALAIANTLYPPPPVYFADFTDSNLARLSELGGEASGTNKGRGLDPKAESGDDSPMVHTGELNAAEQTELAELTLKLTSPNVKWIEEDGRWMCFGQMYTVDPVIPTAESINLKNYVDPVEPPQISLPPILHSFLHTLMCLIDTLTVPARIPGELEAKGWSHEADDRYIQHMTNLAANMMVAANQLRGVQAEATLVLLMEKQVAERKKQTETLRA